MANDYNTNYPVCNRVLTLQNENGGQITILIFNTEIWKLYCNVDLSRAHDILVISANINTFPEMKGKLLY